jgi:hypothetical protein
MVNTPEKLTTFLEGEIFPKVSTFLDYVATELNVKFHYFAPCSARKR